MRRHTTPNEMYAWLRPGTCRCLPFHLWQCTEDPICFVILLNRLIIHPDILIDWFTFSVLVPSDRMTLWVAAVAIPSGHSPRIKFICNLADLSLEILQPWSFPITKDNPVAKCQSGFRKIRADSDSHFIPLATNTVQVVGKIAIQRS